MHLLAWLRHVEVRESSPSQYVATIVVSREDLDRRTEADMRFTPT